ncbi:hypothetical protein W04_1362 [Pseudoalteromonas sp. SW0106-04]|nr:hypothetical protein W04_1362 [Pseudoalteromonas sp. SW0106-04]
MLNAENKNAETLGFGILSVECQLQIGALQRHGIGLVEPSCESQQSNPKQHIAELSSALIMFHSASYKGCG